MANHYIRVADGFAVLGFSDDFIEPQPGDHLLYENAGRHFNPILTNERGQYLYRWDGTLVSRSQAELDAEWNVLPTVPTLEDRTKANEDAINFLLGTVML